MVPPPGTTTMQAGTTLAGASTVPHWHQISFADMHRRRISMHVIALLLNFAVEGHCWPAFAAPDQKKKKKKTLIIWLAYALMRSGPLSLCLKMARSLAEIRVANKIF
jgi:hypothetical protein